MNERCSTDYYVSTPAMSHASSTIQISFLWGSGTSIQGNFHLQRPDIADDRQWSDPTSDPSSYDPYYTSWEL
jgi:hypothetical protein